MNSHLSFITNGEGKGYKFLLLPTAVQFAILAAHFLFVYAPWNDLSGSATVDTLVCLSGTIACSFVFAVGENGFALLFYGSLVEKLIMLSRSLSENSRITRAPVNSFGVYRLAACAIRPVIWLDCSSSVTTGARMGLLRTVGDRAVFMGDDSTHFSTPDRFCELSVQSEHVQ